MEDSKIVELYFDRNETAIQASQEKYGPYCLAVAQNILADQGAAEECVNDTWLRAWDAMPPHRPARLSAFFGKDHAESGAEPLARPPGGQAG